MSGWVVLASFAVVFVDPFRHQTPHSSAPLSTLLRDRCQREPRGAPGK